MGGDEDYRVEIGGQVHETPKQNKELWQNPVSYPKLYTQ